MSVKDDFSLGGGGGPGGTPKEKKGNLEAPSEFNKTQKNSRENTSVSPLHKKRGCFGGEQIRENPTA